MRGKWPTVTEPIHPKVEGPRRPPIGLEHISHPHGLQQWVTLSDSAVEDALSDSHAMQPFVDIELSQEPVPNETIICKFRYLLEADELGTQLFVRIGRYLAATGMKLSRGTIVDAALYQCLQFDEESLGGA